MAYAVREDIIALHGQRFVDDLADRDAVPGAENSAVDAALSAAASEIDAYLSVRYVTPVVVVPAPEMVKIANIEIAVYRLANRGSTVTEDIRKRYEDMIALLKLIAAGKANIGVPAIDNGAEEPVADNFIVPMAAFGRSTRV
jgi:phage gp36-like protein